MSLPAAAARTGRPRLRLSPLNRRRLAAFRANRRGYWAMWLFLALFIASLFAEFIANDRPLFIHFDGKNFFPVFVTYPDTEFGDTLGTAADYRDAKNALRHRADGRYPFTEPEVSPAT